MNSISGKELYHWYREAKEKAISLNIDADEVDWLLQVTTDLSSLSLKLGLFQTQAKINSNKSLSELNRLWQQRLQERFPVQYLVETVFWRRFQLKVTPAVLIPRPETELIIDIAIQATQHSHFKTSDKHWIDLGTGSGAIALGLADSFPDSQIHAVDCSQSALTVARENAVSLGLASQIKFYHGSWWNSLAFLKGRVSGMVANPPYIPTADIDKLQPEVAQHEPRLALDGGADGLDDVRYLVESAPQYLVSGGIWLVELAIGQASTVAKLLAQQGEYCDIEVFPDLSNIDRFVLAYRR